MDKHLDKSDDALPSNGAIAHTYAKLKASLKELLRLYDWRNELGRIERNFNHDKKQMTTWLNQYGREKKMAWDIARNALAHAPDIDVLLLHERIQREAQARLTISSAGTSISGQHLSTDLQEALRIMGRLASIISSTPKSAYADWAIGPEIPYDMVRVAEAFIAKPRSVFATQSASRAMGDIAAERQRQVEKEGWDSEHDDGHSFGGLALAAACYAANAADESACNPAGDSIWPWEKCWWKPKDPRRDLIRAAALIVAEVERMDRMTNNPSDRDVTP